MDAAVDDRVAIVSASFGGRDKPRPQVEQDVAVDWFFYNDGKVELDSSHVWQHHLVAPSEDDPNLAAKHYKMLPPVPHRFVIWLDANMTIKVPYFARNAIASVRNGIAVSAHPRRDCIYDECDASLGAEGQGGRYESLGLREQVEHYRAEGYPAHHGLYACGCVAWDRQQLLDPRSERLGVPTAHLAGEIGSRWLDECHKWSIQDQLSLPVVLWRLGIEPGVFPLPQLEAGQRHLGNRWVRIRRHG